MKKKKLNLSDFVVRNFFCTKIIDKNHDRNNIRLLKINNNWNNAHNEKYIINFMINFRNTLNENWQKNFTLFFFFSRDILHDTLANNFANYIELWNWTTKPIKLFLTSRRSLRFLRVVTGLFLRFPSNLYIYDSSPFLFALAEFTNADDFYDF